jgi:LytR cell envelope-related transcriptional attenuator
VEHSIPTVDLVRPWRTATLVASAVAALELLVLLGIGVVALGKPLARRADAVAVTPAHARVNPKAAPTADHVKLARSETSVIVLNGSGLSGAAAAEAQKVEARGYVIASVGNAPRSDYARTIVMYRPGYRAEGQRLARDLHIGTAAPLDGLRNRDLMGAHAAVVLGS